MEICAMKTPKQIEIETFTWEKLDCQKEVKTAFNL